MTLIEYISGKKLIEDENINLSPMELVKLINENKIKVYTGISKVKIDDNPIKGFIGTNLFHPIKSLKNGLEFHQNNKSRFPLSSPKTFYDLDKSKNGIHHKIYAHFLGTHRDLNGIENYAPIENENNLEWILKRLNNAISNYSCLIDNPGDLPDLLKRNRNNIHFDHSLSEIFQLELFDFIKALNFDKQEIFAIIESTNKERFHKNDLPENDTTTIEETPIYGVDNICNYLNITRKTYYTWKKNGLKTHKTPPPNNDVYAYPSELDRSKPKRKIS